MSLIIGVSGKAQTGKDTFAKKCGDELMEKGYTVSFFSFAYRLKQAVMLIFNLSWDDVNTDKGKEKILPHFNNINVREVLQKFGTEVGRSIYKDIWVWNTMNDIELVEANVAFITDMRFPNEYQAVKDAGGLVVRTQRDNYSISENEHSSETSLDNIQDWNFTSIANNLEEVYSNALFFTNSHIIKEL